MSDLETPDSPPASPGCAQCRAGAGTASWPPPQRIAVNADGPSFLHRCDVCGTFWQFDQRFVGPISEEKARRSYPAHFADWSPRGGEASLPQVFRGDTFPPADPLYLRDAPPEGDLEQALAAAGAGRGGVAGGDTVALMRLLWASALYVPSTTEPTADGAGMTPLALNRPPLVWILAFTRLELARRFAGSAPTCLGFTGSSLTARLPENYGLSLNYGAQSDCMVGPPLLHPAG